MKVIVHEIIGGAYDGKKSHLPCKDQIWVGGVSDTVKLDNEHLTTTESGMRLATHIVKEDGTHAYKLV